MTQETTYQAGRKVTVTYLRSGDVAELLGVNTKTVARYVREGKLPALRTLGGHRRFDEREIHAVLARLRAESNSEGGGAP